MSTMDVPRMLSRPPQRTFTQLSDPELYQRSKWPSYPFEQADFDQSGNHRLTHSRTLPYPHGGQNRRDYEFLRHDQGHLPMDDHGTAVRPFSGTHLALYSRQADPQSWVAAPDSPWNPMRSVGAVESVLHTSSIVYQPILPGKASDVAQCSNVPSDSGYGTRQSVGNTSVFSGDSHDPDRTRPVDISRLRSRRRQKLSSSARSTSDINEISDGNSTKDAQPRQKFLFTCTVCNQNVRTRSELNKHDLRHKKPFHCLVAGCTRSLGFSTKNDLERHTKSKHPTAFGETVSRKRWRCTVPGCKTSTKSWPRMDNFRSHLTRVHAVYVKAHNIDEICRRGEFQQVFNPDIEDLHLHDAEPDSTHGQLPLESESFNHSDHIDWSQATPEGAEESFGHLAAMEPCWAYNKWGHSDFTGVLEDTLADDANSGGLEYLQQAFEDLATAGDDNVAPNIPLDPRLTSEPYTPSSSLQSQEHVLPEHVSLMQISEIQTPSQPPDVLDTSNCEKIAIDDDCEPATSDIVPLVKNPKEIVSARSLSDSTANDRNPGELDLERIIKIANGQSKGMLAKHENNLLSILQRMRSLGYRVEKTIKRTSSDNKATIRNSVTCNICHKFTGRPCELKKHMKRHDRPYGCTFPSCTKRFGSKNDWVRHERSQHFDKTKLVCTVDTESRTTSCSQCFRHRHESIQHLKASHSITEDTSSKGITDSCDVGVERDGSFWCGFCTMDITTDARGVEAWNVRAKHIDDHFMGRNGRKQQSVKEWVHKESEQAGSLSSSRYTKRKRSSSSEDESKWQDVIDDGAAKSFLRLV